MNRTPPAPLWTVHAALIAVQVFFGLNYIAATFVLQDLPPRPLAFLRAGGAAIVLLATVRLTGRRLPTDPGVLWRLALYALLGVGLNQVMFIEGLSRTTPSHSSLINATIPVTTLLMAVLAGRERLSRRRVGSVIVAFSGVVLLIGPAAVATASGVVLGDLLTVANALSFSLFLVLSKPLLSRTEPLGATAVLMSFGACWIGLAAIPQFANVDLFAVGADSWFWLGYIVMFPTAGAYVLQYWALSRVDSSVVAFFIYLQPVLATLLSVLWLGERPGPSVFGGGSLIFAGVWLALARRRRPVGARAVRG